MKTKPPKISAICKKCKSQVSGRSPVICPKCGCTIYKQGVQFTKSEIRTIRAIERLEKEHPDWTRKRCFEELMFRRIHKQCQREAAYQRRWKLCNSM